MNATTRRKSSAPSPANSSSTLLEVRYGADTLKDMRSLQPGEIVQLDLSAKPTQGQMVFVKFANGDFAVRRYFRFRGEVLFVSEEDVDYASTVYLPVIRAACIVGTRRDQYTRVDPEQPFPPTGRILRRLRRSLAWWWNCKHGSLHEYHLQQKLAS